MFAGLRKGQFYAVYMAVYSSEGVNPLFAGAHTFFIVSLKTQSGELIAGLLMFTFAHYGSGRL
jgi:hypothetical protein